MKVPHWVISNLLFRAQAGSLFHQMKKLLLLISITAVCLSSARAAISVGPGGSGVIDFNTTNSLAPNEFATAVLPGGGGTYTTAAGLQTGMNTLTAGSIVTVLPQSGTVPPTASSLGFRQNTNATAFYIQSRPTTAATNAANVLLATLQNNTGGDVSTMSVSYNFALQTVNTADEARGFQVMYSLTGAPGSWLPIPALSDNLTVGIQTAVVNVGTWANTTTLYLIWGDDNSGTGGTDESYTIDDFSVTPGGVVTEIVAISTPTNTAAFSQGPNITINASATMAGTISDVSFYRDNNLLIGTDIAAAYSAIYSNATIGAHALYAVATDNTHSITSALVNITINPNVPPSVTVTNPAPGSVYFVGTMVTNVSASATDTDGSIVRVEFLLDGALFATDTTSPYAFDLCDITAGPHTLSAVAVDNAGGHTTNTISISATNPPAISVIVSNGAAWKYLDNGSDQGTAWHLLAFDDSSWSNGVAELGYGDAPGRPERTTVGFGPQTTNKYPTTYFRKAFNVGNPADYASLNLNVLADDHFIVYLNGVEVFRDMTNAVVTFATVGGGAVAHDGVVYTNAILATSALIAGPNIVAVEVHQDSVGSSDISFDLMLWGNASAGPSLTIVPFSPTQVTVSWQGDATGYTLQGNSVDVGNTGAWVDIGSVIAGAGSTTVTTSPDIKFFRLKKP